MITKETWRDAQVFYDNAERFTREVLITLLIESNHHLNLMIERFGIETLVEMIGDEQE
jgi:hypothetical protein